MKLFTKSILWLLTICLILSTLISCKEKPDMDQSETHISHVIRKGYVAEYGDYVFYVVHAQEGGIYRYNRKTGEYTKACTDPACPGDCLLENPLISIAQIEDGKLFFAAETPFTHEYSYAYLDITNGNIKVLRVCEAIESDAGNVPCVDEGYLYYIRKILKENGDSQNPNDYIPHACRVAVTGGEEEIICALEGSSEAIYFAYKGTLISRYNGKLYSIDVQTKERAVLFDQQTQGYRTFGGSMSFLNGKIYFLARSNFGAVSEYTQKEYLYDFLLCLDVETREVKKLVNEPVCSFTLTDHAIYYSPFELRYLYLPENYESNPNDTVLLKASADMHACDLDGNNDRIVYTNEKLSFMTHYTVIDNVYYGRLCGLNDTETDWAESYFGTIDFETGKITSANKE